MSSRRGSIETAARNSSICYYNENSHKSVVFDFSYYGYCTVVFKNDQPIPQNKSILQVLEWGKSDIGVVEIYKYIYLCNISAMIVNDDDDIAYIVDMVFLNVIDTIRKIEIQHTKNIDCAIAYYTRMEKKKKKKEERVFDIEQCMSFGDNVYGNQSKLVSELNMIKSQIVALEKINEYNGHFMTTFNTIMKDFEDVTPSIDVNVACEKLNSHNMFYLELESKLNETISHLQIMKTRRESMLRDPSVVRNWVIEKKLLQKEINVLAHDIDVIKRDSEHLTRTYLDSSILCEAMKTIMKHIVKEE